MDDGILSPAAIHGGSFASDMDLDYMNELLGDGCWLETFQGSDFLQQSPSSSTNFLNSPPWHSSDTYFGDYIFGQPQEDQQEECPMPSLLNGASINVSEKGSVAKSQISDQKELMRFAGSSGQTNSFRVDETEFGKRWWIGPGATAGPRMSVMDRLVQAIGSIKDSTKNRDVLIQIWVPIDLNGTRVLTTTDQPFVLDFNNTSLANYRNISLNFKFSAEKNSKMTEGMPGRVFLGKVPEWTPDVRFFRSDEYARVDYAQRYNVRGTLALPVFDQGSRTCLGVIEVVTTTQNIKPDLDRVCRALEAVDLSSAESESSQKVKTSIQSYHAALPEILEVMKNACLTHKLPLAQTWMPCIQQGKEGCRHSIDNYAQCVSTVDAACYIADPKIQGFHETCSEHHLLRGQGVAGKAFTTNEPCFYDDITSFGKTEYPLSHHARMFGLHAAVAILLRSVLTGVSDFVLEFFLPSDCREPEEQKKMLGLLSVIIQKTCKSLRVVTDEELANDMMTTVSASIVPQKHDDMQAPKMIQTHSDVYSHGLSTKSSCVTDAQQNHITPFIQKKEPGEFLYENSTVLCSDNLGSSFVDYGTLGEGHFRNMGGAGERKRSKAEKAITIEVLQRHFSGSLKDAARSLGVCPTTLKRICRTQGIKRWPSRKIKKVGHSLEKLQRVIDSVQGPSGTFQIGSFYSSFPELASPSSKSGLTNQFSASKPINSQKTPSVQLNGNAASPPATSKSPSSSCSQSSSSSHSYSSSSQHKTSTCNSAASNDGGNTGKGNAEDVILKKTRSDANLNQKGQEDPKIMPRSQSHHTFSETTHIDCLPPLPNSKRKELDGTRVKVTYGDDKIRIRMPNHWLLTDLRQEIARRFNINDQSELQLKYLDDDSEWVLLTCDADWEECVDVCLSSLGNTIKLSLHSPPHHLGSSLVSSSPS